MRATKHYPRVMNVEQAEVSMSVPEGVVEV